MGRLAPGPEAPVRDARLVLESFADAPRRLAGDLEGVDRRDGVERLQRRLRPCARLGGDGNLLLAQRRQAEHEVDACHLSPAVTVTVRRPVVSCSRCAVTSYEPAGTFVNSKAPSSRERERSGPQDQNDGAVDRSAVLHQRHGACAACRRPVSGPRRAPRRSRPWLAMTAAMGPGRRDPVGRRAWRRSFARAPRRPDRERNGSVIARPRVFPA